MVSMNPNSPEGFYLAADGNSLPGLNPFSSAPPADSPATNSPSSSAPADDFSNKKIRKPYTITKSRESWTEPEHDKFLEALQLFDRDWKKIEAFIGSKTVIQIRSHAQKYFLKVQKSGSNEHLPPPRPKRKAAHPYPQKAPKIAPTLPQATSSSQSLLEARFQRKDTASTPTNPNHSAALPSVAVNSQTAVMPNVSRGDMRSTGAPVANNCSSSTESTAMARTSEMNETANLGLPLRVLPDFSQVYNFIGSVFDPEATDHLQRLKKMDPIDVETVLLLMRNLSVNLTSPAFEDHLLHAMFYPVMNSRIRVLSYARNSSAQFSVCLSQSLSLRGGLLLYWLQFPIMSTLARTPFMILFKHIQSWWAEPFRLQCLPRFLSSDACLFASKLLKYDRDLSHPPAPTRLLYMLVLSVV